MAVYTTNQFGRLVNVSENNEVSTTRNAIGSTPIGSSSNVGRFGDLQTRIINSPAYQSAYSILSNESDSLWLRELESIPYTYANANKGILDNLGLSTRYEDTQDSSFNHAMQAISDLMTDYHSWKNNLPITQSQQFADAGVNSAITGQGITGSDVPVSKSSIPPVPEQEQTSQFLISAASFVLDSVTGLASVSKAFKELGYNQDTQYFEFLKYLRQEGISYVFGPGQNPRTLSEFFDITLNPGSKNTFVFRDPKGDRISSEEVIQSILHNETFAPLYTRWSNELESNPNIKYLDGLWASTIPIGVSAVTDAQYDSYMIGFERRLLENKLSTIQLDNTISLQDKEKTTKDLNNQIFKLQLEEAKIKFNLINKLKESNNIDDKLLLSKVLLGYNYDDIDILHNEAQFSEAEKSLGMLGTVVKMLSGNGKGK